MPRTSIRPAADYSRALLFEKEDDFSKTCGEYNTALAVPAINPVEQWAQDNARKRLNTLDEEGKK